MSTKSSKVAKESIVDVLRREMQELDQTHDMQIMELRSQIGQLQIPYTPKYILWFEGTLTDETMEKIKGALTELGIVGKVISGVKSPTLVHFQ